MDRIATRPPGEHVDGSTSGARVPPPAVGPLAVLGRPGVVADVVTDTLDRAGCTVVSGPEVAGDDLAVIVLADPRETDWVMAQRAGVPSVVVSDVVDDEDVVELLIRGASAVVSVDSPPGELLAAVEVVAAGGSIIAPGPATAALRHLRANGPKSLVKTLTRRECEILASIERGESVKQTARALGISTKTVQNLQIGLYNKLRARNRAQAVARALEIGLL